MYNTSLFNWCQQQGKSYPVLNQTPCHADIWRVYLLHMFLTLALDGSEWSAS